MTCCSVKPWDRIFLKRYRLFSFVAAGGTTNVIGNKITDTITKVSRNSSQNSPATIRNKAEKRKEKYISL